MSQNITLLGASYTDVPAVQLPKTGGGTASFTDVTDTTASASDVASGKYFYTSAGVRTEGTGSGSGPTIYFASGNGNMYTKDIVNTSTGGIGFYNGATYLETYSAPNCTTLNGQLYNCQNLKSASFPKITAFTQQYTIRQQGASYNKLESVTIGSIGYPVTSISQKRWRYGSHAMELVVTCYVSATTLADIPTAVTTNIGGDNSYAPSGSVVTIVYRNSTTGEVITE